MYAHIVFLFLLTAIFAFYEDRISERQKFSILIIYCIYFILLASFKELATTADAENYERIFYNNDHPQIELTVEASYRYLSQFILSIGGGVRVIFFIYAFFTIILKVIAMNKLTPYIFTSMLIYIPFYLTLHDLVQIRAAAATAFLMMTVVVLATNGNKVKALLLILCATFFHTSSLVYLPILLIGNRKFGTKLRLVIVCTIPLLMVAFFLEKDLASLLPEYAFLGKALSYKENTAKGLEVSSFSIIYLGYVWLKYCLLILLMYYYDVIVSNDSRAPIIITLFTLSIVIVMSVSSFPVIATRLSELFGIIDGIAFTYLMYAIRPRYMSRAVTMLVGVYLIFYLLVDGKYFSI